MNPTAIRLGRRSIMLGSNIKSGMTPGGMSTPLCKGRTKYRKSVRFPSSEEIKAAANAALAKRGIASHPFAFESGNFSAGLRRDEP